jgi:G:T-mismatch repair DNA endonuclease (very short patch repair protein)
MNKNTWTNNEIILLKNNFAIKTNEELISLFSNRTIMSIKVKAKRLKLRKNKETEFRNRSIAHLGEKNSMWGKISKIHGKNYDDYYGSEKSKEIKTKLSKDKIEKHKNGVLNTSGINNGMFGKISPNRGITMVIEQRKKISDAKKVYWNNLSDKRKNELNLIRINNIYKNKIIDTKPEIIIENYLKEINVYYRKKEIVGYYNCDFMINDKLIIEVQGDYWHANPIKYLNKKLTLAQQNNIHRDKRKFTYLSNRNYKILYLWENDIYRNLNICKNQINNLIYGKTE